MNETISGEVIFGDFSKTPVKGRVKVLIQFKNGREKFISDVYYVPNVKSNIISMCQLLERAMIFI